MNWDTETDYRITHAGAWRRGHESAAIHEGDSAQMANPYRAMSAEWYAFADGWNAWVIAVRAQREESA